MREYANRKAAVDYITTLLEQTNPEGAVREKHVMSRWLTSTRVSDQPPPIPWEPWADQLQEVAKEPLVSSPITHVKRENSLPSPDAQPLQSCLKKPESTEPGVLVGSVPESNGSDELVLPLPKDLGIGPSIGLPFITSFGHLKTAEDLAKIPEFTPAIHKLFPALPTKDPRPTYFSASAAPDPMPRLWSEVVAGPPKPSPRPSKPIALVHRASLVPSTLASTTHEQQPAVRFSENVNIKAIPNGAKKEAPEKEADLMVILDHSDTSYRQWLQQCWIDGAITYRFPRQSFHINVSQQQWAPDPHENPVLRALAKRIEMFQTLSPLPLRQSPCMFCRAKGFVKRGQPPHSICDATGRITCTNLITVVQAHVAISGTLAS